MYFNFKIVANMIEVNRCCVHDSSVKLRSKERQPLSLRLDSSSRLKIPQRGKEPGVNTAC